ncbi:MAG TPA: PD-(D/E)XK nuclease family protein, partial [Acidimicrobiia bacterium]|nr:PD-(D/E)XK nuclease family protein [Acidimicrobiia bacterium]
MSLPLPTSLTPSKISAFTECALAFRLSAIDRVPEPPSVPAVKGSLVHRALQLLMWDHNPGDRSIETGRACLQRAVAEFDDDPEYAALGLADEDRAAFLADAETLVRRYFDLENPDEVQAIGVELRLEVTTGALTLRGIIDRLDLDQDGELVVTDYKTGRAPGEAFERPRLGGVQFYAHLCEQVLGRRPARVQLLYLADTVAIIATPS